MTYFLYIKYRKSTSRSLACGFWPITCRMTAGQVSSWNPINTSSIFVPALCRLLKNSTALILNMFNVIACLLYLRKRKSILTIVNLGINSRKLCLNYEPVILMHLSRWCKILCPIFQLFGQTLLSLIQHCVDGEEMFLQAIDQWCGELLVHRLLLRYYYQPFHGKNLCYIYN